MGNSRGILKAPAKNYSDLHAVDSSNAGHLRRSGEIIESNGPKAVDQLAQIIARQIEDALEDVRGCLPDAKAISN